MTVRSRIFSASGAVSPALGSALSLGLRVAFALSLLPFFLASVATQIDGFTLTDQAYFLILPQYMEAVAYDPAQISWPGHLYVALGTLAEAVLPVLLVLGLATRAAALGMVLFIVVMSVTDIWFHGVPDAVVGALLDPYPYALILDQRLIWCALLSALAVVGGGRVSFDALIGRFRPASR
ncbi:MAG: hypothetical protein CVT86_05270 [Alphaproteobacteria bacterium HGW-Alphaproteobacteria-8]|nr:MAG: hypothetical protein CVT86_05270 [Alphaproteobacteria bacterium HGW-Alphaproteobacteria-8]